MFIHTTNHHELTPLTQYLQKLSALREAHCIVSSLQFRVLCYFITSKGNLLINILEKSTFCVLKYRLISKTTTKNIRQEMKQKELVPFCHKTQANTNKTKCIMTFNMSTSAIVFPIMRDSTYIPGSCSSTIFFIPPMLIGLQQLSPTQTWLKIVCVPGLSFIRLHFFS